MERIRLVVIDEHTLGYILPQLPTQASILHTSVLKGSYLNPHNPVLLAYRNVRLATEADFEAYGVHMGGFKDNPNYIYQQ